MAMFCLCQSPHVGRLKHSNARENARQCSYLGGDTVRSTWCICKPSPSGKKAFDIGLSGAPTPAHAHRAANRRTHCWRGPWQAETSSAPKCRSRDRIERVWPPTDTELPHCPDNCDQTTLHQSNLCTINVPLHDEHAFDTHVLAARRRHRQKRVVTGADRGTTEPTGFIRGIPVFPGPPLTLGAIQRWMQIHFG
jgi:hypothetical protein